VQNRTPERVVKQCEVIFGVSIVVDDGDDDDDNDDDAAVWPHVTFRVGRNR